MDFLEVPPVFSFLEEEMEEKDIYRCLITEMTDSTWIWMRGAATPLVDVPSAPTHPGDDRPAVNDLIAAHRSSIDALKDALAAADEPLYRPLKHDDLWLLRFVLSHKKSTKKALKAARHALEFRKQHRLDEKDIRPFPPGYKHVETIPEVKAMTECASDDTFNWCLPEGDRGNVFLFCRYAGYDQNSLVNNVPESAWGPAFVYISEWAFQWTDYITRTTGLLTKNVRFIDFDGMSMFNMNKEIGRRDSAAMKLTDDVYPQLLRAILICHSPSWLQAFWRVLRVILPGRLVEKFDFIDPLTNLKERARLLRFIPQEKLPVRFGGDYQPWPVAYPVPGTG